MIVAASSQNIYSEVVWNPLTYLSMILNDNYDAAHRAGAFFIGLGFAYSALFSCVFENVLPAGNDIASLAPKYLTIKRGFAICQVLTVAINPWFLLGSAGIFISFIASYQIFLFSIIGVCLVDYYVISKGRLDLSKLYTADKQGPYWYTYGINIRALIAYAIGAGINFAGFLHNMGVSSFGLGVQRSFYFAFITTGVAAGLSYYLMARFWPQPNYKINKGLKFEEWSQDRVETYAAGSSRGVTEYVEPQTPMEDPAVDEKKDLSVDRVNVNVLEA